MTNPFERAATAGLPGRAQALAIRLATASERAGSPALSAAKRAAREVGQALAAEIGTRRSSPTFSSMANEWFDLGPDALDWIAEAMGAHEEGRAAEAFISMALAQAPAGARGAALTDVQKLGRAPVRVPGLMLRLAEREAACPGGSELQMVLGVGIHGGAGACEAAAALAAGLGLDAAAILARGWEIPAPSHCATLTPIRMTALGQALIWQRQDLALCLHRLAPSMDIAEEGRRCCSMLAGIAQSASIPGIGEIFRSSAAKALSLGEALAIGLAAPGPAFGSEPKRKAAL